jgi:hypothetical protein
VCYACLRACSRPHGRAHLAVFVALATGETMRLDAVQIQIDGHLVANYLYGFRRPLTPEQLQFLPADEVIARE